MKKILVTNWQLDYNGKKIPAQVPGDITIDLYKAGLIEDPYYGMNYVENTWVARTDFTYETELDVTEEMLANPSIELVFDGVDVYSDVYVNGKLVGSTENMFLQYRFEIKDFLKVGKNVVNVYMRATLNKMDTFDTEGYAAVFNVKRLFVRKAQCHFGWDWAPKICAYGIWESVYLECGEQFKIDNVQVIANDKGDAIVLTELNYDIHATADLDGNDICGSFVETKGDTLHYYLSKTPFGEDYEKITYPISGRKNFACFKVKNPELWWPVGYGAQPLYNYKVVLEREGKIVSEKSGRIGFRTVKLVEEVKGPQYIGYDLEINGRRIYVRGSNWIPIECFTGVVEDEKYVRLIDQAVQANCNMLRIWGGGIYEKNIFYDICDEKGVLVWQDVMLACGDIPEDSPEWVENIMNEVEYQVKRLRNHPALIYWTGGNEKTGCYGRCITKGDYFVDVLLRGLINNLDNTRPYARQSPCSYTDLGNDNTSGECHWCYFESQLKRTLEQYRDKVAQRTVPFISEAAFQGPNSVEANKRMYPADKLWPMNELWDDRLMENPYSPEPMTFAQRQMRYAGFFGEVRNLEDFTAKAMMMQTEGFKLEAEFARSNKDMTGGYMTWMYSDIWPSGTWATVDYWCEPKQIFYQMMRTYAPRTVSFVQNKEGVTELKVINDTLSDFTTTVTYGSRNLKGETLWTETITVTVGEKVFSKAVPTPSADPNVYLFADYDVDGVKQKALYSPLFWRDAAFDSDYTVNVEKVSANEAKITVKANSFAKAVFISFKDNYKYDFSDNYLDVEAGESVTITVTAKDGIDYDSMTVTDYVQMTKA